jgi:acyl carrier protein
MTTNEKVCELIIKVVKGKLSQEALKPEASLRDDLGMDSLAMSELLVLSEDAFKISVSLEEAKNVETIADMVACVDEHCAA